MLKQLTFYLLATLLLATTHLAIAQQPDEENLDKKTTTATTTSNNDQASIDDSTKPQNNNDAAAHINSTITAPIDISMQAKSDVEHYLKDQGLTTMLAGPKTFYSLITESESANERGVVVLLPDWQTSTSKALAFNYLAKALPKQGWTTINIHPFSKPAGYPAQLGSKEDNNKKNTELLTSYQENLTEIIKTVTEKAFDYPGLIIIFSQGSNAAQLHEIYQNDTLKRPNALVLLSAFMETQVEDKLFIEQLSELDIATLDLILTKDHPLVSQSAKSRKIIAEKNLKTLYRQRVINTINTGVYPRGEVLRQFEGWLRALGW